ncbi:MAG: TnpV protein [Bacillota bacterium]
MNTKLNSEETYEELLKIWKAVGFDNMDAKTEDGENLYLYDEGNKLWYTNLNGLYYPNILRDPGDLYGKYGAIRLNFLQENHPELVEYMEEHHNLASYLMKYNEEASKSFIDMLKDKLEGYKDVIVKDPECSHFIGKEISKIVSDADKAIIAEVNQI